jgi:predicted phosphoribosyltransferase
VIKALNIPESVIEDASKREKQELEQRESIYRQGRQPASISGRCVILVDDALATGSSMLAAVRAVRAQKPSKTVVAVPVSPPDTCAELGNEVDEIVCALTPAMFTAVSLWYENFSQTSDEDVKQFYEIAARRFEKLAS